MNRARRACLLVLIAECLIRVGSAAAAAPESKSIFQRDNLVAWCIVPFDAKKRSPEQRAEML